MVLYLGHNVEALRDALPGVRRIDDNPHPKDEISRRFAAMDVHLLAIAREGVSTRRTTLMAGLEHGVATVATLGEATDEVLRREDGRALMLATAADHDAFGAAVADLAASPGRRQAIADGGRALFDREFTWERITDQVFQALE